MSRSGGYVTNKTLDALDNGINSDGSQNIRRSSPKLQSTFQLMGSVSSSGTGTLLGTSIWDVSNAESLSFMLRFTGTTEASKATLYLMTSLDGTNWGYVQSGGVNLPICTVTGTGAQCVAGYCPALPLKLIKAVLLIEGAQCNTCYVTGLQVI